jgi:hypothetical protein
LKVCVVHLVWAPLGIEPFRRFLVSYRKHPSGIAHRLLIVYNGFSKHDDPAAYAHVCRSEDYDSLILPRPVQDIAAYFNAARASDADDLCFLNSYSEILDDDWLSKLHAPLHSEGVELVGATGSWESMYSDLIEHRSSPPDWWTPRGLRTRLRQRYALARARRAFAPFPNPHVRTNAFMMSRTRLLSLGMPKVRNKNEAHRFESGRSGLTARIQLADMQVRVVDRFGRAWAPREWRVSRTFRAGEQANLLIADNRTRDFEQADEKTRRYLARLAWGAAESPEMEPDA